MDNSLEPSHVLKSPSRGGERSPPSGAAVSMGRHPQLQVPHSGNSQNTMVDSGVVDLAELSGQSTREPSGGDDGTDGEDTPAKPLSMEGVGSKSLPATLKIPVCVYFRANMQCELGLFCRTGFIHDDEIWSVGGHRRVGGEEEDESSSYMLQHVSGIDSRLSLLCERDE